ncbi:nuclear transport factor 2 family protein [soil metagenome]
MARATTDEMRATLDHYVERFSAGDADGWVALFTEDAVQEDPVGGPPNTGHEGVARFYRTTRETFGEAELRLREEPIIIGNEAVMLLEALAGPAYARVRIPLIVDVVTFADDARISSLRAFWDMGSIGPA